MTSMTFWDFLDKRWPNERGWVTILLAVLIGSLLKMADHDPKLWDVKLFEILIQGCILTGALNMVLAFHFAANHNDEDKTNNTKEAFAAIREVAAQTSPTQPTHDGTESVIVSGEEGEGGVGTIITTTTTTDTNTTIEPQAEK